MSFYTIAHTAGKF